ncbi:MATE family efflux transporter [Acidipila sp. EB88]|uniref:MATE family efflux transporter n=1 Tax=Acidipila sp. EB88 TaxID=2305226 RepID=UPI000F5D5E32|nr:MATE family efflux transporter [Acidipila sp. EB88]RRA48716.1 MATE family efflux transporter [Acidipila sp. EB88]
MMRTTQPGSRSAVATTASQDRTAETARTLRLGGPLALGELGWMSTYIVDSAMIGHMPHSALGLAASSLGNTIFYAIVFCAIRFMTGLETLAAQSFGRGTQEGREESVHLLAQTLLLVGVSTPIVMLLTLAAIPLLRHLGISPEIVGSTSAYLHSLVWSTAPLLLYMATRRYLQSVNHVVLIAVSLLTANLVNAVGDYAFLFGHFGVHAMGLAGSGWATCVVRVYMLGLLAVGFLLTSRKLHTRLSLRQLRPSPWRLGLLWRIGWPDALENITDLGFSTYMSIVCARLGSTLLAAHNIVLEIDAFVYMVPLGLSYATIVRVGQAAGGGSLVRVQRAANVSFALGLGYILVASLLFAGFPHYWTSRYTNDAAVIAAAAPIFLICGFLQLGDTANVLFSAALTGLGDTRTPFLANTVLYWVVGMPLSYFLAFHTSFALKGLWLGRGVAAVLTGAVMALVWQQRIRHATGDRQASGLTLLRPMHAE